MGGPGLEDEKSGPGGGVGDGKLGPRPHRSVEISATG